jgi:hypothetical protein
MIMHRPKRKQPIAVTAAADDLTVDLVNEALSLSMATVATPNSFLQSGLAASPPRV